MATSDDGNRYGDTVSVSDVTAPDTAADAEELHPGAVERVPPEGPFPGFLDIEVEGGRLTAWIDTQDVVTNLEAGAACGE